MSDSAVIAILVFLALLIVFICLRYDSEVRVLFRRLERFRADRQGVEGTFGPAPTVSGSPGSGDESSDKDEEPGLPVADADSNDLDIQQVTDVKMLRQEMVNAVFGGKVDRAKEARERIREVASDPVESAKADALFDATSFHKEGNPAVMKELRERAQDARITAYVEDLIGVVLEGLKRPAEAAEAYKRAYEAAKTPESRASSLASRAKMLADASRPEVAHQEVKEALSVETDEAARARLWKALATTHKVLGQHFKQALALQEARAHEPNNASLCFDIAWALSQSEREDMRPLAIHYYRLATYLDPKHQYALNNLGWEYSKASLSIQAASYYQKAADLGNSLAMANLAGVRLEAGLASEAEDLIQKAQEQDHVHENVAGVVADVSRMRSEQSATAKNLDEVGQQLAEFSTQMTRAEAEESPHELPEHWYLSSGENALVSLEDDSLQCHWQENETKRKFEVSLDGRSGTGTLFTMGSRYSVMAGEKKETGWEKNESLLLVIDSNTQVIRIAALTDDAAKFLTLEASPHGQ